jgi:ADP-ribosylglycohydrolase/fructose-1,6-bisphosphatase/inositol monophosphatase family enzyme
LSLDLKHALGVAVEAARAAGALLRADFHRPGGPRGGGDKAEADTEAERLIRGRLAAAFPSWTYLGEETGGQAGAPGAPVWLVDPNDGTRDYLVGRRGSSVSIGLVADGYPVVGVVFAFGYPDDRGTMVTWAEGLGPVERDGAAVTAKVKAALGPQDVVLVSSKGDRDPEGNLRCAAPARYRTLPSIAHRLALVAAGEAAGTSSLFNPCGWDYAGGHALLRGAGGSVVDEHGREVVYRADGDSRARNAYGGSSAVAQELARRPWSAIDGAGQGPRPTSVERGRAIADPALLSRAQGCLMGQAAGDSLGALVEFRSARDIAAAGDGPRALSDGGHWNLLAGQPTDDTEMALALARSIVETGRYDPAAALLAYRAWHASGPFDVGRTTAAALAGRPLGGSQANGSLMRASPLGIFAHALPEAVAVRTARMDSGATHPHRACGDSVAAYVLGVAHAIRTGGGPEDAYRAALNWAVAEAVPEVADALSRAASAAPECDGEHMGFVLIALQNAFYQLLHAPSLEDGVAATVRRGGDTDTNAAIAGALLGAVHGRDAVPLQWRQMVLSCRPVASRAARPRPLPYWPTGVYEVAERLLVAGNDAR